LKHCQSTTVNPRFLYASQCTSFASALHPEHPDRNIQRKFRRKRAVQVILNINNADFVIRHSFCDVKKPPFTLMGLVTAMATRQPAICFYEFPIQRDSESSGAKDYTDRENRSTMKNARQM
jgi:hypothetical protein